MIPYTIPNNIYFAKDALKQAEGPPGLLRGYLFEPGACYEVRYENSENLNDSLYALSLTSFI